MKHEFARKLRRNQTPFERKLWAALRDRRLARCKFRRQQPIGPYIADFVSFEAKLVIELDGSQHGERESEAADAARTTFLESHGFRVLRFWNDELIGNYEGVVEGIFRAATERPLTRIRAV